MKEVKGKHIVVIGAARSGLAVASLLKRRGADVFVTDSRPLSDTARERLTTEGIAFEEGGHTAKGQNGDFAVVSPGVPTEAPLVQHYLNSGRSVYSEIEASSWFCGSPIVAVTGSNGKTTVTSWLHHLWRTAGRDDILAGNIGYAFADRVEECGPGRDVILEVSSFQLDHIDGFHPKVSLLLNITPDHLDRYQNRFENYARAKFRITENQDEDDWLVYNYDDPVIRGHVEKLQQQEQPVRLLAFSDRNEVPEGAFVRNNEIVFNINQTEEVLMPVEELGLRGKHNLNNGLATALAARAAEIKNDVIRESLKSFEGVEHRLELVREIDGVKYVNDSKATNVNAVWYALDSFQVPLVLIMGGRDKGNDYSELIEPLRRKVHTLIAIGEARDKIESRLSTVVPEFEKAESLAEAVRLARHQAKRGEVVLLSPACASFDMFESYEHRGEEFKKAVNNL